MGTYIECDKCKNYSIEVLGDKELSCNCDPNDSMNDFDMEIGEFV